jgi:hypothetical protein
LALVTLCEIFIPGQNSVTITPGHFFHAPLESQELHCCWEVLLGGMAAVL